jgi:hypothetical protein
MPPNFNYSKVIANWKRDVNSGKINVAPRFRPSIQEQMKSLTANNHLQIAQQEKALSRAIHANTTLNNATRSFHSPPVPGHIPQNIIRNMIKNNETRRLKEAANRKKNQLNKLRGIKRHTEGSTRKNRKTRKSRKTRR